MGAIGVSTVSAIVSCSLLVQSLRRFSSGALMVPMQCVANSPRKVGCRGSSKRGCRPQSTHQPRTSKSRQAAIFAQITSSSLSRGQPSPAEFWRRPSGLMPMAKSMGPWRSGRARPRMGSGPGTLPAQTGRLAAESLRGAALRSSTRAGLSLARWWSATKLSPSTVLSRVSRID